MRAYGKVELQRPGQSKTQYEREVHIHQSSLQPCPRPRRSIASRSPQSPSLVQLHVCVVRVEESKRGRGRMQMRQPWPAMSVSPGKGYGGRLHKPLSPSSGWRCRPNNAQTARPLKPPPSTFPCSLHRSDCSGDSRGGLVSISARSRALNPKHTRCCPRRSLPFPLARTLTRARRTKPLPESRIRAVDTIVRPARATSFSSLQACAHAPPMSRPPSLRPRSIRFPTLLAPPTFRPPQNRIPLLRCQLLGRIALPPLWKPTCLEPSPSP